MLRNIKQGIAVTTDDQSIIDDGWRRIDAPCARIKAHQDTPLRSSNACACAYNTRATSSSRALSRALIKRHLSRHHQAK